MRSCPIKTSKDWKLMLNQLGDNLAWRTWVTNDYEYPSTLKNTSELKKEIGIPTKAFQSQIPLIAKKIRIYNNKNGTSHSFKTNPIGKSEQVNIQFIVNYLPVNHIKQLERDNARKDDGRLSSTIIGLRQLDLFKDQEILADTSDKNNSSDPTLQERLFNGKQMRKANDMLETIANSDHALAPLAKILLANFKNKLRYTNIYLENDTVILNQGTVNEIKAAAYYDPKNGQIFVHKNASFRGKNGLAEVSILHEIMHALSYNQLRDHKSPFAIEFIDIYNKTLELWKQHYGEEKPYALSNIDEFLVALYTDSSFIKKLSNIPSDKIGIIDIIKNFLKKILKLENNSLFDEAFDISLKVITNNKPLLENNDFSILATPQSDTFNNTKEFQLNKEQIETIEISRRIVNRRRNFLNTIGESKSKIKFMDDSIKAIEKGKINNDFIIAAKTFFKVVIEDIKDEYDPTGKYQRFINKYKDNVISINDISPEKITKLRAFVDNYEEAIAYFQNVIEWSKNEQIKNLKEDFLNVTSYLNAVLGVTRELEKESTVRWLNGIEGLDISDPEFEKVRGDVTLWRVWFGSAMNASDDYVRAIAYKIAEANRKTSDHVNEVKKKLLILDKKLRDKGFNFDSLRELDEQGNETGFLISEFNRGAYQQEVEKLISKVERFTNFEGDSEKAYNEFKDLWDNTFIKNHSQFVANFDKDKNIKQNLIRILYLDFYKNNVDSIINEDGSFLNYPKKEYRNNKFKNLLKDKDVLEYYNTLVDLKFSEVNKLNRRISSTYFTGWDDAEMNVYKLPQVRKDHLERLEAGQFKENLRELIGIQNEQGKFNETTPLLGIKGRQYKYLPIYFIEDVPNKDLSRNLTSSYIAFSYMAENYKNMLNIASNYDIMKQAFQNIHYKSGNKTNSFEKSNAHRVLENLIDINVYNNAVEPTYIELLGKRINVTQVIDKVNAYFKHNNLVMKHATAITGTLKAGIDSRIEDFVGIYSTHKSKVFAQGEFLKNIAGVLADFESNTQNNKMHKFFEDIELFKKHKDQYRHLNSNKVSKFFLTSRFWYSMYEIGSYKISGELALSISDNYRYHNGKFYNYKEWKILGNTDNSWEQLKEEGLTFYQLMTDSKAISKEQLNKAKNRVIMTIQNKANDIEGRFTDMDRAEASRTALMRLLLTHRAWLVRGIDARLMKKHPDYQLGLEVEGYWRSVGRYISKAFIDADGKYQFSLARLDWNKASNLEKQGVIRMGVELAFFGVLLTLYKMLSSIADDDDEYITDYLAYLATRVYVEHVSLMSPTELYSTIKSPFPTLERIKYIRDITWGLMYDDEIQRGQYKGMNKSEKALIQSVPGLAVFWEYSDPDIKRNRLEQTYVPGLLLSDK